MLVYTASVICCYVTNDPKIIHTTHVCNEHSGPKWPLDGWVYEPVSSLGWVQLGESWLSSFMCLCSPRWYCLWVSPDNWVTWGATKPEFGGSWPVHLLSPWCVRRESEDGWKSQLSRPNSFFFPRMCLVRGPVMIQGMVKYTPLLSRRSYRVTFKKKKTTWIQEDVGNCGRFQSLR